MNTDNYSVYFWEILQQGSSDLFGPGIAQQICDHLEEVDFMSVRDLYKKIKQVLSQENTERVFNLADTNQLLELHDYIDEKFELLLTDNTVTDQIFADATKRKLINSGHVIEQETKSTGRHGSTQNGIKRHVINLKKATQNIKNERNEIYSSDSEEEDEVLPKSKRLLKQMEKEHKKAVESSFRPNNFECQSTEQILENFNLLHQITYLSPQV